MENPFDALNTEERTDDRYLDRVEFFLSLKKTAASSVKSIARKETKDLLESKGTKSVRLKAQLGGRTKSAPNINKNYEESAQAVGKRKSNVSTTEIKTPSAKPGSVNTNTVAVNQANKNKLKRLLRSKKV